MLQVHCPMVYTTFSFGLRRRMVRCLRLVQMPLRLYCGFQRNFGTSHFAFRVVFVLARFGIVERMVFHTKKHKVRFCAVGVILIDMGKLSDLLS
jgi:hypothetical protein